MDVKKIALIGLIIFSGMAFSAERLNCEYSVADNSKGATAPMNKIGSEYVEFDGKSFKAKRSDNTFVLTPPLLDRKDGVLILDDKTKVFVASIDKSSFAVSDRITKRTEQWANCTIDQDYAKKIKSESEIKMIESMPEIKAKTYFLKEKHAFTSDCLVWGDVTMITGPNPAILMAGSVNMGKSPRWDGKSFSFHFNGGSMIARFTPSEKVHKLLIQAGDKFYGCGPSEVDYNYE